MPLRTSKIEKGSMSQDESISEKIGTSVIIGARIGGRGRLADLAEGGSCFKESFIKGDTKHGPSWVGLGGLTLAHGVLTKKKNKWQTSELKRSSMQKGNERKGLVLRREMGGSFSLEKSSSGAPKEKE